MHLSFNRHQVNVHHMPSLVPVAGSFTIAVNKNGPCSQGAYILVSYNQDNQVKYMECQRAGSTREKNKVEEGHRECFGGRGSFKQGNV